MYTYMGEIFKEVRQARHISLKNAAGEDFSYSMLSRFENGEADLSSSKLLTALDNIHMDLSEFSHLVKRCLQSSEGRNLAGSEQGGFGEIAQHVRS